MAEVTRESEIAVEQHHVDRVYARVEALRARAESVGRSRWPRATLQSTWSRSELPAGVFASKLNSGQFGAADFELENLNDPAALGHAGRDLLQRELPAVTRVDLGKQVVEAVGQRRARLPGVGRAGDRVPRRCSFVRHRYAPLASAIGFMGASTINQWLR